MKKLLMGALFLLPLSAMADGHEQQVEPPQKPDVPFTYWANKPIQCSNMETVIAMVRDYGEVPTIIMDGQTGFPNGLTTPSKFVISLNPETETWTLIEFVSDEQACVLGSGKGNIALGKKQQGTST